MGIILSGLLFTSCERADSSFSQTDDVIIKSIISMTDLSNTDDVEQATTIDDLGKTSSSDYNRCFTVIMDDNGEDVFWIVCGLVNERSFQPEESL